MSIEQAMLVSVFCILVVFSVLLILYCIIRIFSRIFYGIESGADKRNPVSEDSESSFQEEVILLEEVTEENAAMIMAIISEETKIPLSKLKFKSIKKVRR